MAGAPEDVRQLDLKAVAVGLDPVEVNRLKRATPETLETAGRVGERHAGDGAHVFARKHAEQKPVQRPVDHTNALAIARAQHEVSVLRLRLLEEARDVVRVVGEVAVHLEDKIVVSLERPSEAGTVRTAKTVLFLPVQHVHTVGSVRQPIGDVAGSIR